MLSILAFLAFILALLLFWQSGRQRRASGLPGGRVIYSDTSRWAQLAQPLYDATLGLAGKPDYLVEKGGRFIPVEVKSTRLNHGPYDSHIFQLAAYCLLVQHVYGERPPYGILHYSGPDKSSRSFAIDYTSDLENAVLELLNEMHAHGRRKELSRSHEEPPRCRGCGYQSICNQSL